MQITGVQPVGARSLGSVSATVSVSDSTQAANHASASTLDRDVRATPRTMSPEAVVFPRDGKPLDPRPVQLRQQRAHERYRKDGGKEKPG